MLPQTLFSFKTYILNFPEKVLKFFSFFFFLFELKRIFPLKSWITNKHDIFKLETGISARYYEY